MNVRPHYLDVTSVIDREEIAAAYGAVAAWDAAIKSLTAKEARETDRIKKKQLRLALYNAQVQRELLKFQ